MTYAKDCKAGDYIVFLEDHFGKRPAKLGRVGSSDGRLVQVYFTGEIVPLILRANHPVKKVNSSYVLGHKKTTKLSNAISEEIKKELLDYVSALDPEQDAGKYFSSGDMYSLLYPLMVQLRQVCFAASVSALESELQKYMDEKTISHMNSIFNQQISQELLNDSK